MTTTTPTNSSSEHETAADQAAETADSADQSIPENETKAAGDQPSETRPQIPIPRRLEYLPPMIVGLFFMLLVYIQFGPIFETLGTTILGDEETDAIKGMWSFDHVRRSMLPPETPIWSDQANYPEGVLALVLPWVSAVILSPLGGIFGPIIGWNLSVVIMVWALGMSTAWLVRVTTKSWAVGAVAGSAMLAQPLLMHAIGDGTPEHVSLWTIPIFLVAAWKAFSDDVPAWGVAAGLAATLVTLDSPYNAVYTFVIGLCVLPMVVFRRRKGAWVRQFVWTMGSFLLSAGLGVLLIWLLYRNFPIEGGSVLELPSTADQSCQVELSEYESRGQVCLDLYHQPANFSHGCRDSVQKFCSMNTTDLRTWWQFDTASSASRDASLAPTLIPTGIFAPILVLALIGAPRAIPWLFAGLLMTALSLDLNPLNPSRFETFGGPNGLAFGEQVLSLNAWLNGVPGIRNIRFPHRWLVPGALCLMVAGSHGLARLFRWLEKPPIPWLRNSVGALPGADKPLAKFVPKGIAILIAIWLSVNFHESGIVASRIRQGFPSQELPEFAFAEWVRDQPGDGAFVLLPESRRAPTSSQGPMRAELPVFANLDERLSGSDQVYLQVLMNRPSLHYPGLKTIRTMRVAEDKYRIMRNWDDLTHPVLTGNPIPSSVYDPRHTADRQRIITELRHAGLRFVIVDSAAYEGEALEILTAQLEQHTLAIHEFDDGDGVMVFELGER